MDKVILFSQAPADIKYVLFLYEKFKDDKQIDIIVVNVENNFKYLQSLNLKARLYFVPVIGAKNILKLFPI